MMATANEDGSIDVSWNTTEPVNLYRAEGSGDLEYIDTWTPLLDIKILLKTVPAVLTGRGAS